MTATNTSKEIAAGFALAGLTMCLGVYFSVKAGDGAGGRSLIQLFNAVAVLIVLKVTFAWGRLRGFPARQDDGHIAFSNVLRNLVMAAIMFGVILFAFAPLVLVAFRLAR
jgi:hypothetical protein